MGDIARVKVGKYNLVARSGKCKVSVRVGKHKLGTRAGRCQLGVQARAGKNKLGARACKYKLGARDGKYKLGARAGTGDQEIKRLIPIPHCSSEDINKTFENQKIKLYKIGLYYTVCNVFKNYRM